VEFKAMASGSHSVDSDVVYFKAGDLYGVSCYQKRMMRGRVEIRGVLMSAVGLLATSFYGLERHIPFLTDQVHAVNHSTVIDDELLEEYLHTSGQSGASAPPPLPKPVFPELHSAHMVDFVRHFGPSVFAIWKSVVLRQRILFHSPPPIKDACAHVYCANMISFTHVAKMRWDANPLFYVNINDMKMLNEQEIFIACTTESIFQKKFNIYDIYIAQHTFHTPSKETLLPLRTTAGDRLRYQRLLHIISAHPDPREAGELILKFFLRLNGKLFEGLLQARQELIFASDLPQRFGLHTTDIFFFFVVVSALNIELQVAPPKACWCC